MGQERRIWTFLGTSVVTLEADFLALQYLTERAMNGLSARRQDTDLFDHLVRGDEKRLRHGEPERIRSLEIDRQLELGRRLHRKVARRFPF